MIKTELRGGHVFIEHVINDIVSYAYIPRNQEHAIEARSLEKYGLPKFYITHDGKIISLKTNRIIKQTVSKTGYYVFSTYPNGRLSNTVCFKVHRLLAMEFVDNPDNKPFVNHKNGKKLCNLISNLEWVTNHENVTHAHANGLCDTYYTSYDVYDLVNNRSFTIGSSKAISELLGFHRSALRKYLRKYADRGRYTIYDGYVFRPSSDEPWNLDNIVKRKYTRSYKLIRKSDRSLHHFDDLEQLVRYIDVVVELDHQAVADLDDWFIHAQ